MLLLLAAVSIVLIVSFTCSIFESVLLSLNRAQIEVMVRRGKPAGQLLARFKENIDVPIAAILILNTAAHTIGAAVAGASYSGVFDPSTLWIFSLIFTLAVLLFTEIIPKTIGVSYATALAGPVAYGIKWLTIILRPLVLLSERISRLLRRDAEVPVTSVEELRLLASLGRTQGVVGAKTASMIVGATHLRQLRAHDVMLPRQDVCFLSGEMTRDEVIRYMRQSGHSRFPFSPSYELDDVTGVVLAKDLLYWLLRNDGVNINWAAIQRELIIVPDSVEIPTLLDTYQRTHRHLAVVVDEYGSVVGIATLEDVLEEIVGDIKDESDIPVEGIVEESDDVLVVRSRVDLRTLCNKLQVPWDPNSEVTTIGGLFTETLERIPIAGDTIHWNGYRIEVLKADRRRAKLLALRRDDRSEN
jgi:CBS domain containing-hemolysin-like protein